MRIPKRVNAVLDWVEQHFVALAAVVALVVVALVALLAPAAVGFPVAGFVLGTAAGGFVVHMRLSRRIARARSDVDNLLRENGALRHRNTVLASGVITRESQETQALVSIPEDDLLLDELRADPQGTVTLDELLDGDPTSTDELPGDVSGESAGDPAGEGPTSALPELPDDDPQRTAVLTPPPEEPAAGEDDEDTARTHRPGRPKSAAKKKTRKN
ncbi:hypothetical protein [Actinomadura bangladeshensis]|uniref:Uncharacterized protein n=1 Tax=Actinomadura bangladeshensis TaxID=453573 RepID=A0A6L9QL73_9ACTN|nr:hypothetical protein [Actinomadura bangladeshensis]NEA26201.1 hypothetical protein [Actinomadura bangladeshensis]